MMLQHRDPATSDFAVEWLLGELVEFSLFEFLVGTVPGGASETVTLGIVEARAADDRWNALQLTIDVTLPGGRSEEHTSELQSLMRISYAVFCLKKKSK